MKECKIICETFVMHLLGKIFPSLEKVLLPESSAAILLSLTLLNTLKGKTSLTTFILKVYHIIPSIIFDHT